MEAAELHNDRVVHTSTYLRDVAQLSAVFDGMNQQLLIARSFVPEAVLLGKTDDSHDARRVAYGYVEDAFAEAQQDRAAGHQRPRGEICSAQALGPIWRKSVMRVCECKIAVCCCDPASKFRRSRLARRSDMRGGLSFHCINLL